MVAFLKSYNKAPGHAMADAILALEELQRIRDLSVHLSSDGKPDEPVYTRADVGALLGVVRAMELNADKVRQRSQVETKAPLSEAAAAQILNVASWLQKGCDITHAITELTMIASKLRVAEEPNGNQADSASSGADAAAPMPRGSLPNSLGAFPEKTSSELCGARWEMADRVNIYCTLPKGHAAQHEAWGTTGLFHAWSAVNGDERNDG